MANPAACEFRSGAARHHQGNAAEQGGHGGHHDRAETQRRRDRSILGATCPGAVPPRREVDHHIAFFFTMTISRMMPIRPIMSSGSRTATDQRAPTPATEWSTGWSAGDEAFVENPSHDIDRDQGGRDQVRHGGQRCLECLGVALERRVRPISAYAPRSWIRCTRVTASPNAMPGRQVE